MQPLGGGHNPLLREIRLRVPKGCQGRRFMSLMLNKWQTRPSLKVVAYQLLRNRAFMARRVAPKAPFERGANSGTLMDVPVGAP